QAEIMQPIKTPPHTLNAWKCGRFAKHVEHTHYIARRNRKVRGGTRVKLFQFFKNVSREMKKVTWTKGRKLTSYKITVISSVSFIAIFFSIVDLEISQFLNAFFE